MTLKDYLDNGQLSLTVYSPETLKSMLPGHLDQFIHQRTQGVPVHRFQFKFDRRTISNFYANSTSTKSTFVWQAINELFELGPSMVTLWQGQNMIPELLKSKGKTHPAKADGDTIRGRYWCDSPLTNLLHSSDSESELLRELSVVNGLGYLNKDARNVTWQPRSPLFANQIQHSGIILFCKTIVEHLNNSQNCQLLLPQPLTDLAIDTNQCYTDFLLALLDWPQTPVYFKDIIRLFIAGNPDVINKLSEKMNISRWDRLMISCSAASRNEWNGIFNDNKNGSNIS
jgi:nucleoside diphosphate kinase